MPRKRKLRLSEFTATVFLPLERFSIEFSEAKTKEITKENQNKGKTLKSHRELRVKSTKLLKARENAGDQAAIGLSFAFDWFREWREFSGPITEWSKTKSIQFAPSLSGKTPPVCQWSWYTQLLACYIHLGLHQLFSPRYCDSHFIRCIPSGFLQGWDGNRLLVTGKKILRS